MIMGIYISELILRIYALHPHLFFQRWYNWFDFVVSYEKMYEKGREKNIYIQIYILKKGANRISHSFLGIAFTPDVELRLPHNHEPSTL